MSFISKIADYVRGEYEITCFTDPELESSLRNQRARNTVTERVGVHKSHGTFARESNTSAPQLQHNRIKSHAQSPVVRNKLVEYIKGETDILCFTPTPEDVACRNSVDSLIPNASEDDDDDSIYVDIGYNSRLKVRDREHVNVVNRNKQSSRKNIPPVGTGYNNRLKATNREDDNINHGFQTYSSDDPSSDHRSCTNPYSRKDTSNEYYRSSTSHNSRMNASPDIHMGGSRYSKRDTSADNHLSTTSLSRLHISRDNYLHTSPYPRKDASSDNRLDRYSRIDASNDHLSVTSYSSKDTSSEYQRGSTHPIMDTSYDNYRGSTPHNVRMYTSSDIHHGTCTSATKTSMGTHGIRRHFPSSMTLRTWVN